jgi:hypothetical protein
MRESDALLPFPLDHADDNSEIDQMGMGRYQICIWFLCGFGYFLDLAWSQGVGLIGTSIL